jgi:serine/threonine-protein kinase
MALTVGTQLGSHEITALLGKGGMGEVYRARDLKLKRDVAIKILPEEFRREPESISRFQREAEILAALNHHHIAAIYDLQQIDSTRFLILELVEGETLAELIQRRGPLPIDDALKVGKQICEAMEAAHERGIIHRDLKPANVKVHPDGDVKVLDFGLAKTFAHQRLHENDSNSPTVNVAATNAGAILGTASYMSPEQARGRATDRRTDTWAFGCVLYEMLTGKQAFRGDDATEILASVVKSEPDWQALPAGVPSNIRTLLLRCLQKDIKRRIRDAGDIAIELEHALSPPAAPAVAIGAAVPTGFTSGRSRWIALAGLLVGGVIAGVVAWRVKPAPAQSVNRFAITLPASQRLVGLDLSLLAFSPDGKRLVFVGRAGGTKQLYLRELDSWQARPIQGTEGASNPFFSPDGEWIAFFTVGRLKKVSINGGTPVALADVANPRGGSWGADGNIVFASKPGSGLSLVSSGGGAVRTLTTPDTKKGEVSHRFPHYLANTDSVLFTVGTGGSWDDARIEVLNPATGATKSTDITGAAQADISALGSLAYVSGNQQASDRTLVWVDRKGNEEPIRLPPRFYRNPRISPDGQRVVLDIDEGNKSDLWIYDVPRGALTRTTFEGDGAFATWTPDGKKVAFQNINGSAGILRLAAVDGRDRGEALTTGGNSRYAASWSPDGDTLAVIELDSGRGFNLWTLSLKEGRKLQPFLQTPFNETNPSFSRDGRWIAYQSDESGHDEIYVQPFPGPGGKIQVSIDGGTEPVWSADGHEIFYRDGDKMITVAVTLQPSLHPSKPEVLFEKPYFMGSAYHASVYPRSYDVAPDGKRFLMIKENEQVSMSPRSTLY